MVPKPQEALEAQNHLNFNSSINQSAIAQLTDKQSIQSKVPWFNTTLSINLMAHFLNRHLCFTTEERNSRDFHKSKPIQTPETSRTIESVSFHSITESKVKECQQ
jgi:hypothetical protein